MPANSEDLDLDVNKGSQNNNQKTIIIVAAIFAVVTLLAVGLTIFFLKGANPPAVAEGTGTAVTENKKEEKKLPPKYLEIKPPFLIHFMTKAKIRYLQVEVSLMIKAEEEKMELVKSQLPLIKNNLTAVFQGNSFDDIVLVQGREKMRIQALDEVKKLLKEQTGETLVENVLFTSYVIQ